VWSSYAQIWHNNGDGTFSNIGRTFGGTYSSTAAVADFDRDGRLDFVVGGALYRNLGGNSFTNVDLCREPSLFSADTSVAWGDYDNDGYPDLAICGLLVFGEARFLILHNLGDGTFTNLQLSLPRLYRGTLVWADYNADGRLDLLVQGVEGGTGRIVATIFRND